MSTAYTYDSGGVGSLPGGGDPDYSSLVTWEADTDIDMTGQGVISLECYDSQIHVDFVVMAGATNTDKDNYRIIRSAAACATPFAGKKNTGANFNITTTSPIFSLNEHYVRVASVVCKVTNNSAAVTYAMDTALNTIGVKILNCVIHDCSNVTNVVHGIRLYGAVDGLVYNTIIYNCDGSGIQMNTWVAAGARPAAVCCTAIGNGGYGLESVWASSTAIVWSCYAADNTSGNFNESNWDAPSGWNAAKDTTADLGGTAGDNYKNSIDLTDTELDADYLAVAGQTLSWNGAAGDRAGRNPYNDLTATVDFYDFFKNDTSGETLSKEDIVGNSRPTPDTADVEWAVGASQAVTVTTITAEAGSIAITGQTAGLLANRQLSASGGSVVITGTSVALFKGFKITADPDSVILTGQDVSFDYTQTVTAVSGSIAITGQTIGIIHNHILSAASGSILIRVPDIPFIYTGNREHIAQVIIELSSSQPGVEISSERVLIEIG